jgi:Electron transfer DM13
VQIAMVMKRHPRGTILISIAVAALAAAALYWFAPWNLFIDKRVDEALPGTSTSMQTKVGETSGSNPAAADAEGVARLAQGSFSSLEHETSGRALVVELPDGMRYLRLEGLETSNGPDLRVYLSSVPAQEDWYVYDDAAIVDLGGLKGNLGSSNYLIPAGTDLSGFRSAVIWCRRFSVGFGVAPLDVAA